jgi:hypothetical protein
MSDAVVYALSDVFNEAKVPSLTFVPPKDFDDLVGSLRTPGKHVTLSGPSGCGKTTLAEKAIGKANIPVGGHLWISGRDYSTANSLLEFLSLALHCAQTISETTEFLTIAGLLIIDDFHHLQQPVREGIAARMKRWGEHGIRIFIIGISGINKPLLDTDPELGIRNDPYEMGIQNDDFISKVMAHGEQALNFRFDIQTRERFIKASLGVPSAIQLICRVACIRAGLNETAKQLVELCVSMEDIKDAVLRSYKAKFQNRLIGLAKGKQQAKSVHNTYFEIVKQICMLERSEIPTAELHTRIVKPVADSAERNRKNTSFYNCLNNLSEVIEQRGIGDAIYYNRKGTVISIEDPSFRLYLTLVDLEELERSVRVRKTRFPWDVAVSFAGEDRLIVEQFRAILNTHGYTVFYDFDEQHKLWGENLRRKLGDVYAYDAQYMVIFLSKHYPEKDWSAFEFEIGKAAKAKRVGTYLLPIIVDDVAVVGLSSDVAHVDLRHVAIEEAANLLIRKIEEMPPSVTEEVAS